MEKFTRFKPRALADSIRIEPPSLANLALRLCANKDLLTSNVLSLKVQREHKLYMKLVLDVLNSVNRFQGRLFGGAIRSLLTGQVIKDFDIQFEDKSNAQEFIGHLLSPSQYSLIYISDTNPYGTHLCKYHCLILVPARPAATYIMLDIVYPQFSKSAMRRADRVTGGFLIKTSDHVNIRKKIKCKPSVRLIETVVWPYDFTVNMLSCSDFDNDQELSLKDNLLKIRPALHANITLVSILRDIDHKRAGIINVNNNLARQTIIHKHESRDRALGRSDVIVPEHRIAKIKILNLDIYNLQKCEQADCLICQSNTLRYLENEARQKRIDAHYAQMKLESSYSNDSDSD